MYYNKMEFKKINIEEFIINHKHIYYCEAIIYPDGDITYAVPSHTESLVKILGYKDQMDFYNTENPDIFVDIMEYLLNRTKCVCVWYSTIMYSKSITEQQQQSLIKLQENKLINL